MWPVYGTLKSFRTFNFVNHQSYIADEPQATNATPSPVTGKRQLVDTLGGGRAALTKSEVTWVYWMIGSGGSDAARATDVETQYNNLLAVVNGTNTNGTSGETGTLTIYKADGINTVSVQARLVDMSFRDSNRTAATLELNLVFACYGEPS